MPQAFSATNGFTNADEFTIGALNIQISNTPYYATYFNGTIDEIVNDTVVSRSEIQTNSEC
jgi:hypothetical protein